MANKEPRKKKKSDSIKYKGDDDVESMADKKMQTDADVADEDIEVDADADDEDIPNK